MTLNLLYAFTIKIFGFSWSLGGESRKQNRNSVLTEKLMDILCLSQLIFPPKFFNGKIYLPFRDIHLVLETFPWVLRLFSQGGSWRSLSYNLHQWTRKLVWSRWDDLPQQLFLQPPLNQISHSFTSVFICLQTLCPPERKIFMYFA